MAVTTSVAGPYYSSGAISFSSLRSTFKEVTSGAIKASDLIRETSTSLTNPIVPNCTENTSITTNQSNWTISDFRNSIKYYYVTLPSSDTVTNFDIDAQTWNSNLNKNIRKWIYINGTCGSSDSSSPAATFNATAYNLTIDVSGNIYGAAGIGATEVAGGAGGHALSVTSSGGDNIVVNVGSGAKIYGGGGGGAKGHTGDNGSAATCKKSQYFQQACQQGAFISCPSGWNQTSSGQNCCEWKRGCNANNWWRWCEETKSTSTPSGGTGGNGGKGRGYDNPINEVLGIDVSRLGATGGPKQCPSCDSGYSQSGGSCSEKGQIGGTGGDWGANGGNKTKNSTTWFGGPAGYAILKSGDNISVTGSTGPTTLKGLY